MLIYNEKEINKAIQKCTECKYVFYCENIKMFITNNLKELLYLEFEFNKQIYLKCPLEKFILNLPRDNQIANLKVRKSNKFRHILYFLKKYKEKL